MIDDDDMAIGNVNRYAQGNALISTKVLTEIVRMSSALFKSNRSSLYTSALWYNYRSESLRKLCIAYNNVFRKITFLPRDGSAMRDLPTDVDSKLKLTMERLI